MPWRTDCPADPGAVEIAVLATGVAANFEATAPAVATTVAAKSQNATVETTVAANTQVARVDIAVAANAQDDTSPPCRVPHHGRGKR